MRTFLGSLRRSSGPEETFNDLFELLSRKKQFGFLLMAQLLFASSFVDPFTVARLGRINNQPKVFLYSIPTGAELMLSLNHDPMALGRRISLIIIAHQEASDLWFDWECDDVSLRWKNCGSYLISISAPAARWDDASSKTSTKQRARDSQEYFSCLTDKRINKRTRIRRAILKLTN